MWNGKKKERRLSDKDILWFAALYLSNWSAAKNNDKLFIFTMKMVEHCYEYLEGGIR